MAPAPRPSRLLAVMAHPDDTGILEAVTLFHLRNLGWQEGILTI